MICHVVMLKFREAASAEDRERAVAMLRSVPDRVPGVTEWRIGTQYAPPEGRWDAVEIATFPDQETLLRFRAHPAHRELTDFMKDIADWHVVDFVE